MSEWQLTYQVKDRPPWQETGLYGLQWLMISVPLLMAFTMLPTVLNFITAGPDSKLSE